MRKSTAEILMNNINEIKRQINFIMRIVEEIDDGAEKKMYRKVIAELNINLLSGIERLVVSEHPDLYIEYDPQSKFWD